MYVPDRDQYIFELLYSSIHPLPHHSFYLFHSPRILLICSLPSLLILVVFLLLHPLLFPLASQSPPSSPQQCCQSDKRLDSSCPNDRVPRSPANAMLGSFRNSLE